MLNASPQPGGLQRRAVAVRLGALGLLLCGLPGCQNFDISGSANVAQLRVVDASLDSPGIDMYHSGSAIAYNLAFGTVTSYVPLAAGTHNVAAMRAGTTQTLISSKQNLAPGHQYTAIIGNIAANMRETFLVDQNTPAPAGLASVRVVNQALRPGAVDLYLVQPNGKLTTTSPFATGVSFQGNTGYINVPAGRYALAVVPAGAVISASTSTMLSGSSAGYAARYAAGSARTIILLDQQSATAAAGVQAVVATDYDPAATMD